MLQPARTKYRKAHKGRIHGNATRGEILNYGAYGLKAMQPDRIISKQIEAARDSELIELGILFGLRKKTNMENF